MSNETFDSYVRNCLIQARDGETVFYATNERVEAALDGYAIIPMEVYKQLTEGKPEVQK